MERNPVEAASIPIVDRARGPNIAAAAVAIEAADGGGRWRGDILATRPSGPCPPAVQQRVFLKKGIKEMGASRPPIGREVRKKFPEASSRMRKVSYS
jgi:hypothetical protein